MFVVDAVGKSLDCVLVVNTCINNNIHAEIKSMPPVGVAIPILIFASASKYSGPENNTVPAIAQKIEMSINFPGYLCCSNPDINKNKAW